MTWCKVHPWGERTMDCADCVAAMQERGAQPSKSDLKRRNVMQGKDMDEGVLKGYCPDCSCKICVCPTGFGPKVGFPQNWSRFRVRPPVQKFVSLTLVEVSSPGSAWSN